MRGLIRYAIDNRAVAYFVVAVLFFGGIAAYFSLGQLEDPVFSIKTAAIVTRYPGASPEEVELEVTDRIEKAVQEMVQLKQVSSTSRTGESVVKVDIQERYWSDKLPQIWDELRKKAADAAKELPPGAGPPLVMDDYGFVYGFLLALTGDGFSDRELEQYADAVKKELSLVKGVTRVELWGVQPQAVYVEISEQKLNELGISGATMARTLSEQNIVVDAGSAAIGRERLGIRPTGEFRAPEEIGQLKIQPSSQDALSVLVAPSGHLKGPQAAGAARLKEEGEEQGVQAQSALELIRLEDIAEVLRGYRDPPEALMRFNGYPAIGIQISGADDENIVEVGRRVDEKIKELEPLLPIGVELNRVAWQSDVVEESVRAFFVNLLQAVAIVLVVLIIPSGLRMGAIIGSDLVLTILATFIVMAVYQIPFQRMSLGALIISLGMMVDNAIVVSDGIGVRMRRGMGRIEAAVESAGSSAYPLFAATLIAILAFYPIAASEVGAGEYTQTLFYVVAASLFISWLVALFITPLQCVDFLPEKKKGEKEAGGEFETPFYNRFRKLLKALIRLRGLTVGTMAALLLISLYCFGFVEQMFFPDSSRPQIMVDYWAPVGTRIQDVSQDVERLEKEFLSDSSVAGVSSFVGAGPPRFYLPVDPEGVQANYAQLIVNFHDFEDVGPFIEKYEKKVRERVANAMVRFRKYGVGPSNTWPFELRISGPANSSYEELRRIGKQVLEITERSPYGMDWRVDMQNRTLKLVPEYDQKRARLASITRSDLARATRRGYDGVQMGIYREKDKLLPIIARSVEEERRQFPSRLDVLKVQPQNAVHSVPLAQAVSDIRLEWEDPILPHFNRRRSLTVQGVPVPGETYPTLEKSVRKEIEALKLPPGYSLYWDGESSSTKEAQQSLIPGMVPAAVMILFLIITVFNAYRPLFIILLTIPFAVIGITWGLLLLQTPFGFLALLGAMSLIGMMNKNIVVLLDACNENLASGMGRLDAIVEASVTRVRPVLLAAGTTVLGVAPLVTDLFWTAMAVTIMAGLSFGSLLTLIVVPVLYTLFYRVEGGKSG